jgi:hypothetical protein
MKTANASGPDLAPFMEEQPMPTDQEALLLSPRETGTMLAGLALLRGACRVAYQRSAAACARILPAIGNRDHGAGDGLPQVFRMLGHAVHSFARFAAANPRPIILLLLAVASVYFLYENYRPQQIA